MVLWNYPDDVERAPNIPYGASAYWSPQYGAHPTWGGIGIIYERNHGTHSYLGFPKSDDIPVNSPFGTTGVYQVFEGGIVCWCEQKNLIVSVCGAILRLYNEMGGTGQYGFPLAPEEETASGGHMQRFEGGMIAVVREAG